MLNRAKRASHIDPPASSYAIMRRARPYRGENPAPGKDVHGELDPTPGIREQPRPIPDISGLFLLRCTGLTCYTEPADPWPWGTPHEVTRFHQTDWRCGGGMATRGARAAGGESADHRIAGCCHGYSLEPLRRKFCAAIGRIGLGRRPHGRDRIPSNGCTERMFRRDRGRVRSA